jgi:hypothetical protein
MAARTIEIPSVSFKVLVHSRRSRCTSAKIRKAYHNYQIYAQLNLVQRYLFSIIKILVAVSSTYWPTNHSMLSSYSRKLPLMWTKFGSLKFIQINELRQVLADHPLRRLERIFSSTSPLHAALQRGTSQSSFVTYYHRSCSSCLGSSTKFLSRVFRTPLLGLTRVVDFF